MEALRTTRWGIQSPAVDRNSTGRPPIRYRAVTEDSLKTHETQEAHGFAHTGEGVKPYPGQIVDVKRTELGAWREAWGKVVEVWKDSDPIVVKVVKATNPDRHPPSSYEWGIRVRPSAGKTAGTPVERLINGTWKTGWVIADGSDLDSMVAAQLGNPMLTFSNLRWGLDVREATGSPFADPPAEAQDLPLTIEEEFPL